MNKRDALIHQSAAAIGITLTHSNNHGGWSRGVPYTRTDVEFDPLNSIDDAIELAVKIGIDIPFGSRLLNRRKAMLYVTVTAAKMTHNVELSGKQMRI